MAFWATAQEPTPGAWDNMKPVGADSVVDAEEYNKVRSLYDQAFNQSLAWQPSAAASLAGNTTIGRNDLEARKLQDAQIARLQAIASGAAPGVAAENAYANLAAGAQHTNALTASKASPNNIASARRLAGNTNQAASAGAANRIAGLKAQEQLAAYDALNPALASMRAQDWGVASAQAGLNTKTALANAGQTQSVALARQDARNRQQAATRAAFAGLSGTDSAYFNAKMGEYRAIRGDQEWDRNWNQERQRRTDAQNASYLNTLSAGTALGADAMGSYNKDWYAKHPQSDGGGTASDARVKKGVRKVSDEEFRALMQERFRNGLDGPPPDVTLDRAGYYRALNGGY